MTKYTNAMKTKQLLLIFTLFAFTVPVFAQDEFTLVKMGDTAPDFSFSTENGQTKKISELKGKVVWINFFATWCGPCRQELPHLQKEVYDKLKSNKNFELIILGREHSWKEINKFKTDNKFNMPFYPDTGRKVFSAFLLRFPVQGRAPMGGRWHKEGRDRFCFPARIYQSIPDRCHIPVRTRSWL